MLVGILDFNCGKTGGACGREAFEQRQFFEKQTDIGARRSTDPSLDGVVADKGHCKQM